MAIRVYQFAHQETKEEYLVFVDDTDERVAEEYALSGFELSHSSYGMDLDVLLAEAVLMKEAE